MLCGVPASVAVPFPLSVSTSPPGSELAVEIEGKGKPVVVMIADIGTSTDAAKEPDEVKAGDDRVATVKLPGVVAVPAMVWTLTGPLVVATVRSRAEHQHAHSGEGEIEDIRRLVNLSVK